MEDFEITNKVSEADVIVIAETCCGTQYSILNTINYLKSNLDNKTVGAKIYLTGCITRKFKDNPFLNKVETWLKENVDYIIPQNQPNLLL
jgi:tRNA A37 methylthiotransferase MiaB